MGVPNIRITCNHHRKINGGTHVPGSNNQFLPECNANTFTDARMRGVEMSRRTQRNQIYATSSTRSREFQELEMKKHLHGPEKRLPVHETQEVRRRNKVDQWEAKRKHLCWSLGCNRHQRSQKGRKENANEHWKTVVNGLVAEPKSPCVESGHV